MSKPPSRRSRLFRGRDPKQPSERDWERSAVLEPRPAPRRPELVSDGSGLAFPLEALRRPPTPLDPRDEAVAALLAQLIAQAARRGERATIPGSDSGPTARLDGWRLVAATDDEALFALGLPPRLFTVALRREGRRRTWVCVASSAAQPLRAARGAIRASAWRPDPTREVAAQDTMLRILVTEQAFAGGQRADGRVLAPDIYVDEHELVLTMFVTPRPGYQTGARNPETPVRVALAHNVGSRRLVDGALVSTR